MLKYITVHECEGQFEITEQSDEYKNLVFPCFSKVMVYGIQILNIAKHVASSVSIVMCAF